MDLWHIPRAIRRLKHMHMHERHQKADINKLSCIA